MEDVVLIVEAGDRQAIHVEGIEVERLLCAKLARSPARRRGEARLATGSPLGEDLYDAVVGTRAVERGSGGTSDYLNVLDVIRIEIGESVLRIGACAEVGELAGLVVYDDAVDDVERIGAGDEGVDAAETDGDSAAARAARVLRDLRTGNLTLHRLIDRRRLRPTDQSGIDGGDVRSDFAFLSGDAGSGDNHFTEVHRADAERNIGSLG